MGKPRNKRRPASEVVQTFTREDVLATIAEMESLSTKATAISATIAAMRAANMSEEAIETVRAVADDGVMARYSYLEAKIRRVSMALHRASGRKAWIDNVMNNLDRIPTAASKATLATL